MKKTDLQQEFGEYGHVVDIELPMTARGVAFVQFDNVKDAQEAMEEVTGRRVKGMVLKVKPADLKPDRPAVTDDAPAPTRAGARPEVSSTANTARDVHLERRAAFHGATTGRRWEGRSRSRSRSRRSDRSGSRRHQKRPSSRSPERSTSVRRGRSHRQSGSPRCDVGRKCSASDRNRRRTSSISRPRKKSASENSRADVKAKPKRAKKQSLNAKPSVTAGKNGLSKKADVRESTSRGCSQSSIRSGCSAGSRHTRNKRGKSKRGREKSMNHKSSNSPSHSRSPKRPAQKTLSKKSSGTRGRETDCNRRAATDRKSVV